MTASLLQSEAVMGIREIIESRLEAALAPSALEVIDESHLHAGHAGARPEGETHFRVRVVSDKFEGLSRVDRQRLVYDALREEMNNSIHALALKTLTPGEAGSR
jgi:BolA family transcriptional regulator, general stress-responsive regulator